MKKLRATRPLTYGTRRLQAGDAFEATPMNARILCALRKAEPDQGAEGNGEADAEAAVRGADEKAALIAEAEEAGVTVDRRWGIARLRSEIEQARGVPAGES